MIDSRFDTDVIRLYELMGSLAEEYSIQ